MWKSGNYQEGGGTAGIGVHSASYLQIGALFGHHKNNKQAPSPELRVGVGHQQPKAISNSRPVWSDSRQPMALHTTSFMGRWIIEPEPRAR
jgi:hypothetical protein